MLSKQETAIGLGQTDSYSEKTIRTNLEKIGYEVLPFEPETPSTMLTIQNYALKRGKAPAVAYTNHQTQGVGREGRVWHDKQDASVLLSALFKIDESAIASFADLAALAACLALREITGNKEIKIKYPNDIVFGGEKLGGLLTQNIYHEGEYLGTMVGIGINVHYSKNELKTYPTDYGATSLDIITCSPNSRNEILMSILEAIFHLGPDAQLLAQDKNRKYFDTLWRDCSAILGQNVTIIQSEKEFLQGCVVDTQVGKGILVRTGKETKWVNTFNTDMKVRVTDQ